MVSLVVIVRVKGQRDQRQLEQHSITADELHALLESGNWPAGRAVAEHQKAVVLDLKTQLFTAPVPATKPAAPSCVARWHFITLESSSSRAD